MDEQMKAGINVGCDLGMRQIFVARLVVSEKLRARKADEPAVILCLTSSTGRHRFRPFSEIHPLPERLLSSWRGTEKQGRRSTDGGLHR